MRHWLERYQADKESGLQDRPRAGRPRTADSAAHRLIRHTVERSPQEAGHPFGYWTTGTLAAHLAQTAGVCLSAATVRRVLHALTYRWRRPLHTRLTLPVDPAAARIMWQLYDRIMQAPAQAAIVCLDECDVHLLPVVRAMWMRRGQQAGVPTPGSNRKRAVFGALDWSSGRWHYQISEHKRASEFITFLEHLLLAYPEHPLLIVLDNAWSCPHDTGRCWEVDLQHSLFAHSPCDAGFCPLSGERGAPGMRRVIFPISSRVLALRHSR